MEHVRTLQALGLFDARVPRYTSYPTAAVFSPTVGADFQQTALRSLGARDPVSVYIQTSLWQTIVCYAQRN